MTSDRKQHDRRLHDRQRPAHEYLARWRHDAVSQREEHQLGRSFPRPLPGPLARQDQGRDRHERTHEPQRLGSHARAPSQASGHRRQTAEGYTANGNRYKVHLDGYDQSKFLTSVDGTVGKNNGAKSARDKFFYSDDDGLLVCLRQGDYKYVFSEQRKPGTMGVWAEPFTTLRLQKIYNLMQDPYERADITSNTFWDWNLNHVGIDVWCDGHGLQVRGNVQGVSAALLPTELQPCQRHGRSEADAQSQGGFGEGFPNAAG